LSEPHSVIAQEIVAHIAQADPAIGQEVQAALAQLTRPVLVLTLDGMAGFHLGNALVQTVFAQLQQCGVDAGAIRDLSPRFKPRNSSWNAISPFAPTASPSACRG
jgi:hypothetical protein